VGAAIWDWEAAIWDWETPSSTFLSIAVLLDLVTDAGSDVVKPFNITHFSEH
jgi:hypothetical protein